MAWLKKQEASFDWLANRAGSSHDYFPAEARRLGAAIMKASEDAAEFLKATTVWSKAQRKDFKDDFKGELAKAVYRFAEPGRTYTVEMGGCEINGKRQRLSVISIDGVAKADMYSEDLDLSHDAAAADTSRPASESLLFGSKRLPWRRSDAELQSGLKNG